MTTTISDDTGCSNVQPRSIVQEDLASPYFLPAPQTWQDVKASRASGTTYTNTTGQPIKVSVWAAISVSSGTSVAATVGGLVVAKSDLATVNNGTSLIVDVPAGSTYSVTVSAPNGFSWTELR